MFKVNEPSMCLNSADLEDRLMGYKMWNTRRVEKNVTPFWLAANIASVAAGTKLSTLIFNCHGLVTPENDFVGLAMGTEVYLEDLRHFAKLNTRVDKIYMTVCAAARGTSGKAFCKELARITGSTVVAGEKDQILDISVAAKLPVGFIDEFEGDVYEFIRGGDVRPFSKK